MQCKTIVNCIRVEFEINLNALELVDFPINLVCVCFFHKYFCCRCLRYFVNVECVQCTQNTIIIKMGFVCNMSESLYYVAIIAFIISYDQWPVLGHWPYCVQRVCRRKQWSLKNQLDTIIIIITYCCCWIYLS